MEWKPIESAPKDGTLILAYADGDEHAFLVRWGFEQHRTRRTEITGMFWWRKEVVTVQEGDKYGWFTVYSDTGSSDVVRYYNHILLRGFTHWMPLPNPPSDAQ